MTLAKVWISYFNSDWLLLIITVAASGLQLFIAKDGTAAVGNHEVKSQMSTGVQVFKQVVMDDNR